MRFLRRILKASLFAAMAFASTQATFAAGSAFEDDTAKILSTVEREMPGALEGVSAKDRAKAINAMLEASGCGAAISDNTAVQPSPAIPGPSCLPGITMHSNKILYLRMNRLDKEAVSSLHEECIAAFRLMRRPAGIALDLRNCRGGSEAEALGIAKNLKQFETPVAVLIGSRTSGGAELLAAILEHERQGLSFGASTAGKPFPVKKVECGEYALALPQLSKELPYVKQMPLKPSIEVGENQQEDYAKLSNELRSEESDHCLSRAVDLLVSLDAVKRKWGSSPP